MDAIDDRRESLTGGTCRADGAVATRSISAGRRALLVLGAGLDCRDDFRTARLWDSDAMCCVIACLLTNFRTHVSQYNLDAATRGAISIDACARPRKCWFNAASVLKYRLHSEQYMLGT